MVYTVYRIIIQCTMFDIFIFIYDYLSRSNDRYTREKNQTIFM